MKIKLALLDNYSLRATLCLSIIGLLMLILIGRLISIQLIDSDFLIKQGNSRILRAVSIPAHRGVIFDRNNQPLAVSTQVFSIAVDPMFFKATAKQLQLISKALKLNLKKLTAKTERPNSRFVYLQHQVPPYVADKIRHLKLPGVYIEPTDKRYYPTAEVAAHLVGFTNLDGHGQEGIELYFEQSLKAVLGRKNVIKNLDGKIIKEQKITKQPLHGQDLHLSIDMRLQYLAYRELKKAVQSTRAHSGSVIILDASHGKVLAMVNQPSYNPNDKTRLNFSHIRNRAVTDVFEPGSTLKPFTLALALSSTELTLDSVINTAPGYLKIDGQTIRDVKNYGQLSVQNILVKSSNVGMAKISKHLSGHALINYLDDLGFGRHVNIEFPGEKEGYLPLDKNLSLLSKSVLAYGYGLSITSLQLAQAYMLLANNGRYMPISLLADTKNYLAEQIIPKKIAKQIKESLIKAASKSGTGRRSQVAGYVVAGKTGTVHKVDNNGYAYNKYMAIFAGLVPANKPALVIVVVVDEPQGDKYYGGEVAAPTFSAIATRALSLLNINPL